MATTFSVLVGNTIPSPTRDSARVASTDDLDLAEPATKRELDALQKEVNELRRSFQDETKWTHDELQKFDKWFNDERSTPAKSSTNGERPDRAVAAPVVSPTPTR